MNETRESLLIDASAGLAGKVERVTWSIGDQVETWVVGGLSPSRSSVIGMITVTTVGDFQRVALHAERRIWVRDVYAGAGLVVAWAPYGS